jgi:hypothetical protein
MTMAAEQPLRGREARVAAVTPRMRRLLQLDLPPPRWKWEERAECGGEDPALFELIEAPGRGWSNIDAGIQDRGRHDVAKAFCDRCPVQQDCLATALNDERVGTWGGERLTATDWEAGRKVKEELGL